MTRSIGNTPQIFLSYSHKDGEFGTNLVRQLRRVLNDDDAVWFDDGLVGGQDWWERINQQLTSRKTFIVLLSPDALKSSWVKAEMHIAWQRHMQKKMRFIPVEYRSCKVPKYLRFLSTRQFVSFLPPSDYNASFRKLLEALNISRKDAYISSSGGLGIVRRQSPEDESVTVNIQKMSRIIDELYEREDWHGVVTVTKAFIDLNPYAIPASIYEKQGCAYLYAESVYEDQYSLAQSAFENALARESDPKLRLDLLDLYAFVLVKQGLWNQVSSCIKEAHEILRLVPNHFTREAWQALQAEMPLKDLGEDTSLPTFTTRSKVHIVKDIALVLLIVNFFVSLVRRFRKKQALVI